LAKVYCTFLQGPLLNRALIIAGCECPMCSTGEE
jgi:hypothetical protein